jgi:hypothetical protein
MSSPRRRSLPRRAAAKLNDPTVLRRIHFWGIWFWVLIALVATLTGWINSTAFISFLSIVALSLAHWAAYQGTRTEEKEEATDTNEPNTNEPNDPNDPTDKEPKPHEPPHQGPPSQYHG